MELKEYKKIDYELVSIIFESIEGDTMRLRAWIDPEIAGVLKKHNRHDEFNKKLHDMVDVMKKCLLDEVKKAD